MNERATRGWLPGTVVYGMPIGPPFHVPEPKSAFRPAVEPMLATQVDDCGSTGSDETSACQNESAGVTGHEGASGTGVPSASDARTSAAPRTTSRRLTERGRRRVTPGG